MFCPERLTALYGEEKSEEGVRGDPNEMRWNHRGESGLASNLFLMCTPQLDCSEMFMYLYREEKRRGRKETEVARRIKVGNQTERDRSSQ